MKSAGPIKAPRPALDHAAHNCPNLSQAKVRSSHRPPFFIQLIFSVQLIFEVRMSSDQYRKIAAECLDRARHARKSEDVDAWLLIAEDWLRLAAEFDAPERQSE